MADKKPDILIIWGDDIGAWNISYTNRGMLGYRTTRQKPASFDLAVCWNN